MKSTKRKTTEEFVCDAIKVHGSKYDYSKVKYINAYTKVCIVCPEHGEFWQTPHSHLNGRGCPKCVNKSNYKSTKEFFVERAKKIHGDKYDYSKVNYVNVNTPVCIICPEHGEFWQTPHSHLDSRGCKLCSTNQEHSQKNKYTKDIFIEKAKRIHGDKYDYSKVNYVDSKTKVCIICPEHGEFWQKPSSHLQNRGCNLCSKPVHDIESFVFKSNIIHKNKYDYSKSVYINNLTPLCIICPEHGEFWQTPGNHLSGKGCYICKKDEVDKGKRLTNVEFIKKAKKVHGDKYDYSKVDYVNMATKICIICPEHGEFWQTPLHHLQGEECPKCRSFKLEREVMEVLSDEKIEYIKEFTPKWDGNKRYDFCIPSKKIIIECQGEQHYFPVDFTGKRKELSILDFKKNVENDKRKKIVAEEKGYTVIYYTKEKLKKSKEITSKQELINILKQKNNDLP